jgi:hypothetical protein
MRKNRRHYGTPVSPIFNARKHNESDSYIDPYDGMERANNQMNWLLKKGKDLPSSGPAHAKIIMKKSFWLDEKRDCYLELRASNNANAPNRSVHTVRTVSVEL